MKLRLILPALASLLLLSSVAVPDDAGTGADAGPTFESLPFPGPVPAEKSKPPTFAEWQAERDLSSPVSPFQCGVRRVREWMRFRCEVFATNSIDLVAGNQNDVFFSVKSGGGSCTNDPMEGQICWDAVEAVFPIRRGDRRFFQITRRTGGGYYMPGSGPMVEPFAVLSEIWVEDEPGPVITLSTL